MIALSHGGTTAYTASGPSPRLLVGTAGGVFILDRAGLDWKIVHRALPHRHVSALIFPAPGLVYAGAFHDSVYISRDRGETWEHCGDGIEPANVGSLAAVHRDGGLRLYAGTEPAHLFCSDDLGRRWTELPALRAVPSVPRWMFPAPPHDAHVKHIVPDPVRVDVLYACIEQGALLKSTDGGESWRELHGVDEDVHFLVIDPRDPERLYITGGNGCYATSDGGVTWKHLTTRDDPVGAYPDTLVLASRDPALMFMGAARGDPPVWRKTRTAQGRVCRSRDGGRTWEVLGGGLPRDMSAAIEAMTIVEGADSISVYVGTTAGDIYASEDGGESWTRIAFGLPPIAKYGHDRALVGL